MMTDVFFMLRLLGKNIRNWISFVIIGLLIQAGNTVFAADFAIKATPASTQNTVNLSVNVQPDQSTYGQPGSFFVVAQSLASGDWFYPTLSGWQSWNPSSPLPPYITTTMQATNNFALSAPLAAYGTISVGYGSNMASMLNNGTYTNVYTSPPSDWFTQGWQYVFEPVPPPAWQPQGTLIASSGFVLGNDSFSFVNYGSSTGDGWQLVQYDAYLSRQQLPYTLVNLTSAQMISLFGSQSVCMGQSGPSSSGCTLTPVANDWMQSVNRNMTGGHCFGMATTAAQLFNGQIQQSAFGSSGPIGSIRFASPATANIAQAFATQFIVPVPTSWTAQQAVQTLYSALKPGAEPYVLSMNDTSGGGHAIAPIALYSKGNNQYDIAVYDNNYPQQTRAIHADTAANTLSYELFPGTMLAGNMIGLTPVSTLLGPYPCQFCQGATSTEIKLSSSVATDSPATVSVTAPDGSQIPGLITIPPTNPWKPGQIQSFPSFKVPNGVPFQLNIGNTSNTSVIKPDITIITGEIHVRVSSYNMAANSSDVLYLNPTSGNFQFQSGKGSSPTFVLKDYIVPFFNTQAYSATMSPNLAANGVFSANIQQNLGVLTAQISGYSNANIGLQIAQIAPEANGKTYSSSSGVVNFGLPSGSVFSWNYLNWQIGASSVTVKAGSLGTTSIPVATVLYQ